jgi:hypothetical protein
MLRKLEIGLIAVVATALIGNLQGEEPEKEHPLRGYFKKKGGLAALPFLKTEMVQKELGLTDAQKEKTAHLKKVVWDSKHPLLSEVDTEITKKLESILEPRQIDRLLEIMIQSEVPMALFDTETNIGKLFEWTDDQKEKIKVIAEDTKESMDKVINNQPPTNDKDVIKKQNNEILKKLKPIIKEANDKMQVIMTPKQHDMLDKMRGKEVDMAKLIEEFNDAT